MQIASIYQQLFVPLISIIVLLLIIDFIIRFVGAPINNIINKQNKNKKRITIPNKMLCESCNEKLLEADLFCWNCGFGAKG